MGGQLILLHTFCLLRSGHSIACNVSAMSSSVLKTTNFKIMTNDNKQHKPLDSTEPAIAYSTCYPQFFSGDIQIYNGNNIEVLQSINLDLSKCIFVSDPPFNIGYHYD